MEYREQRLPPPLDAFVECVWFLTSGPEDVHTEPQRILPDGCVELVFHVGARFLAISRTGLRSAQPSRFIVGLLTLPFLVQSTGGADTMGVRFRPGCAWRFVPCAISALTDRAVALDDLWGRDAERLWQQLASAAGEETRLRIITEALTTRLARAHADGVTAAAVGDLVRSAGRARVTVVAARVGVTTRHLQRRFAERVGVSPKVLARILRFQNTLRLRAPREARTDWARVASMCGYADQSHLIHDYASFAGGTPASLLAAEGELSSYITAPQRLAALFDSRRYA